MCTACSDGDWHEGDNSTMPARKLDMPTALVTGVAGFIGLTLAEALLDPG